MNPICKQNVLLPNFVYPIAEPIDLMELMIARRHQQILQKRPGVEQEIEHDQQEAKTIAEMMHERGMNTHQPSEQLCKQVMQHKLNFLNNQIGKSKIKAQATFRKKQKGQEAENKPPLPNQQARDLQELPYHYSRFERNLNAYHLEYDTKERHVKQCLSGKDTKRLSGEKQRSSN